MTNLLPDLTPWEYESLKASIARVGLLVPILKDEFGNTIDGYQRERACQELGITDFRIETVAGLTDEEKRDRAFTMNLVRRRLNQQQMRDLIAAELKRMPDLSDNWPAQILGTTDKTVASVREKLIATSESPKLEKLRGRDGKCRRVTRIMTNSAKHAERAQVALQTLGDQAPRTDLELRLAQRKANRVLKLETVKGREAQPPGLVTSASSIVPFRNSKKTPRSSPTRSILSLPTFPMDRTSYRRSPSLERSSLGC